MGREKANSCDNECRRPKEQRNERNTGKKMKIDIALIQETHWENNGEWEQGDYTFYVTSARKMERGTKKKGYK